MGGVGLEPTRIATLVPKTSASAIPPPAHVSKGFGLQEFSIAYRRRPV